MTAPTFLPLTNDPRPYAWGMPGGISRLFGDSPRDEPEAELWFGAHPASPSRVIDGPIRDLAEWERVSGARLPFLLKILAAAGALSLQAHPNPADAAAGFEREEALGIPRDAPQRNYRDPNAKPELIVALEDGFEALCGFQPVDRTIQTITALSRHLEEHPALTRWTDMLHGSQDVRGVVEWLLTEPGESTDLLHEISAAARRAPAEFELALRLESDYPGDPGIAVALMLNHVTLRAGECLWLPAGNIHAYLRGIGVELMGPSDNVLRGGLTPKHVDVPELLRTLDVVEAAPPFLEPQHPGANLAVYRPATVPSGEHAGFSLLAVTGPTTLQLDGPAIAVTVDGRFALSGGNEAHALPQGSACLIDSDAHVEVTGRGRMFVAVADRGSMQ